MGWRTIIIRNPARLNYSAGYLVVVQEKTTRIVMEQIKTLIIESNATVITTYLLNELSKRDILTVICDEKHLPCCLIHAVEGSKTSSERIREQAEWSEMKKQAVWTEIVRLKIKKQIQHLEENHIPDLENLYDHLNQIEFNDSTNREAVVAQTYFRKLFREGFTREEQNPYNAALNYGYALILSAFSREIISHGYITQLGIHHHNIFNGENLASDLMEPFRILVDRKVIEMNPVSFDTEQKTELISLLNKAIKINGKNEPVYEAISIYCESIFRSLNSGVVDIQCYEI